MLRQELTKQLQQRRHCEIARAFLAAVNLNLLFAASEAEQELVYTRLRGLSGRSNTTSTGLYCCAATMYVAPTTPYFETTDS